MIYDWEKLYEDSISAEKLPFRNVQYIFPIFDYSDIPIIEFNHYRNLINHGQIINLEYESEYNENYSSSQDLY